VYVQITQKTKLVHASTTASSLAMLEQARLYTLVTLDTFVSTRSTRKLVCCVVCIKL